MLRALLHAMAPNGKQPECPSTGQRDNKSWSTHTVECYSATRRNKLLIHACTQYDTSQNNYSEWKKRKKRLVVFIEKSRRKPRKCKLIYRNRKRIGGCLGVGGGVRSGYKRRNLQELAMCGILTVIHFHRCAHVDVKTHSHTLKMGTVSCTSIIPQKKLF